MPSGLTDHQRKFIDSLRLDYGGGRDTRDYLNELLAVRREEAATLRAIEARWDGLQAAIRNSNDGRAQADARQLARGAIRALSSFGLPGESASRAANAAEAVLRDDSKRDFTLLAAVMREVANPTRPRLAARLARVEEEIFALEMLLTRKSPKRAVFRVDRLPVIASRQTTSISKSNAPRPPGPRVGIGPSNYGIYRDVNAAIVDALALQGDLKHTAASQILARYAPYAALSKQQVARASLDYLRFVADSWKDLGKEVQLEGSGDALILRKVSSPISSGAPGPTMAARE